MDFSSILSGGFGAAQLTSYFSLAYLAVFLPATIVLYWLMPQKARRWVMLIAGYAFFWIISGKLVIFLILTTFSIHWFGLWLDKLNQLRKTEAKAAADRAEKKTIKKAYQRRQRGVVFLAAVLHIGTLLLLKYSPFFTTNINSLLESIGVHFAFDIPKYILPIGISFFTMQAMSYIFDVYNGTVKADHNLLRLALYIGFFPQIVEGPIC